MENKKAEGIFHYYKYLTYLMGKEAFCYPNANYGYTLDEKKVLSSWETTVNLIEKGLAPKELFLYVHIPFCQCSCLYCLSGTITVNRVGGFIERYLEEIYQEMKKYSEVLSNVEVTTVYVGGGTPSILSEFQIQMLIKNLKSNYCFTDSSRIIFEASPFTLDKRKIDVLKHSGIYELALGIQSFDQDVLNKNSRPQRVEQSIEIIKYAKSIGIPSVTVDIMVGMPFQGRISALESVKKSIELNVDAILINEFLPLEYTRYSKEGNRLTAEEIVQKKETATDAGDIILSSGYLKGEGGYRKRWDSSDVKHAYKTQGNHNLLGFGYGSYSHAYGTLKYQHLYDFDEFIGRFELQEHIPVCSGNNFRTIISEKFRTSNLGSPRESDYFGLEMSLELEMHVFLYTKIFNLNLDLFEAMFGNNAISLFRSQFALLRSSGLILVKDRNVCLTKNDFVIRKAIQTLFVDKDYIRRLIERSTEPYFKERDYDKMICETRR